MPKKKAAESTESPTFEQSLERLEAIVHRLEEGDLGLDEALGQYEEGVGLLRRSYELLKQAERRIELLSGVDAEGNPIAEPFDDQATFAAEGGSSGPVVARSPDRATASDAGTPAGSGEPRRTGGGTRRTVGKRTGRSGGQTRPRETDVDSEGGLF